MSNQISICRPQTLSIWKSLKFVVWERVKIHFSTSVALNPLLDMPTLGSFNSAANKDLYDVKNIDKWGYNFLIE